MSEIRISHQALLDNFSRDNTDDKARAAAALFAADHDGDMHVAHGELSSVIDHLNRQQIHFFGPDVKRRIASELYLGFTKLAAPKNGIGVCLQPKR